MSATALADGDVLVAGGSHLAGATWEVRAAALRFSPTTEAWEPTGELGQARSAHQAVRLENGEVLAAGGVGSYAVPNQPALSSAELFDPGSGDWSPTGAMRQARAWYTATLLSSGEVLVVGGYPSTDHTAPPLSSAEIYDPATGEWSDTGSLQTARGFHGAALLPSGRVLVAGGCTDGPCATGTATVEIWDPDSGQWGPGDSLPGARVELSATRLPSGRVLVAGGCVNDYSCGLEMQSAFLYGEDGAREEAGTMPPGHASHVAVLLTTGKVLLAAGDNPFERAQPGNVFDPETSEWTLTGPMHAWHGFAAAGAPLPGGKALFAGGALRHVTDSATAVVEIYEPEP
jgi:hypothetical protein